MKKEFFEIAHGVSNRYIEDWKREGKKIIGIPCSFVPEEIIHAAGMMPFRLRGTGAPSTTFADAYFGHVICSLPKCILELAGQGGLNFLDGVVISDGCDAGRRLDECWRKAGGDHENILPEYHHYFSVPHKTEEYSVSFFKNEISQWMLTLQDNFDVTISDDALRSSISVYNHSRKLLKRLDEFRVGEDVLISGKDVQAVVLASSSMPREEFIRLLEELLDELEKSRAAGKDGIPGKRLMLVGSPVDDTHFIETIEKEGAVVVADNQCFGTRSYVDMVDEKDPEGPLTSLAKRYLDRTFCPRMFGYYKERFKFVINRVKEANVDGVILQNIRFCDLHGADNGLFKRDLEKEGVPSIVIEREYGPLAEEGRVVMRVDAFLDSIG